MKDKKIKVMENTLSVGHIKQIVRRNMITKVKQSKKVYSRKKKEKYD
jgi:hypothetical protein